MSCEGEREKKREKENEREKKKCERKERKCKGERKFENLSYYSTVKPKLLHAELSIVFF